MVLKLILLSPNVLPRFCPTPQAQFDMHIPENKIVFELVIKEGMKNLGNTLSHAQDAFPIIKQSSCPYKR